MSDFYNDTLDFLEAKGITTEFPNINIYLGQEPDPETVEQTLTLIPSGGFNNDPGDGGVEYPGIQFIVRDKEFNVVTSILRWIKKTLTNTTALDFARIFDEDWDSKTEWDSFTLWENITSDCMGWENTGSPIPLGKDSKERWRMSDNYIIYCNEEV